MLENTGESDEVVYILSIPTKTHMTTSSSSVANLEVPPSSLKCKLNIIYEDEGAFLNNKLG